MKDIIIHGKNDLQRIVGCEISDDVCELFIEHEDGKIESVFKPNKFYILSPTPLDVNFKKLNGNQWYKWIKYYSNREEYIEDKKRYYKRDIYTIYDEKESAMVGFGFTYFKGLRVNDVSVLSFDIETTSLNHTNDAKVLLISNTYRFKDKVERKLFSYDDYESEAEFLNAWCDWVREKNPSVMLGHNIFVYDLPYLNFIASRAGTTLKLGRDNSDIKFNNYDSKFRKDGSQFYEYKRCFIYGREIIDTMFLAYQYDIGRQYESYGLKPIIKHEKLEVKDRVFYDADKIRINYTIPEEWEKIKQYAIHDADDALALYDLMIPSKFYFTQYIPKSFQQMGYSASGSQLNSFLLRSYLQIGHSIPKTTEANAFEGATSFGNAGIYKNVYKVDVASLYPSIMLEYEIFDKHKDPYAHFYHMVSCFTEERLKNKKLSKDTGDRYYKDLEQSQKIAINSSYGLLGAPGLQFNSPYNGALVTRKGREILKKAMDWAELNSLVIVNGDTDSISFCKKDQSEITEEEQTQLLNDLNSNFPNRIKWEDDGIYSNVLIVKAKNYVLKTLDGKIKSKGSALKATMKEKALQQFNKDLIALLLEGKVSQVVDLYHSYIKDIYNLKDITNWCSKKTITESVLNPERTNEQKILDAIDINTVQEGDKIYVYFTNDGLLKLRENWTNDHDPEILLKKLYNTIKVFETVLDIKLIPKYHLKNHTIRCQLHDVLELPHPEKVKRTRKKSVQTEQNDDIIDVSEENTVNYERESFNEESFEFG